MKKQQIIEASKILFDHKLNNKNLTYQLRNWYEKLLK